MTGYPDGLSTPECCHKVASAFGCRVILWEMRQAQTTPSPSRCHLGLRQFRIVLPWLASEISVAIENEVKNYVSARSDATAVPSAVMRQVRLRDSTTQGCAEGGKGHTKAPHNTGRVGESDHDRRGITCELSAVQRAKMNIMVRPTIIPTMPTTMLEVLTGRSRASDSSLRSAAVTLPIRNIPSLPANPATHKTNERTIRTVPTNHQRTVMSLSVAPAHATLYQPNPGLDTEGTNDGL